MGLGIDPGHAQFGIAFGQNLEDVNQPKEGALAGLLLRSTESSWKVGILFFALLALTNLPHFFDPPYWDGVVGFYAQVVWLSENSLNPAALAKLPNYLAGGPNISLYYALSYPVAWAMRHTEAADLFFLLHLGSIAMGALCLFFLHSLMREFVGGPLATLFCLAGAVFPVFSGQVAGIYLEVPVAMGVMATLFLIQRDRFGWAAAMCLLTYFFKDNAILFALACALWAPMVYAAQRHSEQPRSRRILLLVLPAVVMFLLPQVQDVSLSQMLNLNLKMALRTFTNHLLVHLPIEFSLSLLGWAGVVLFISKSPAPLEALTSRRGRLMLLGAIAVGGYWSANLINRVPLPRYVVSFSLPILLVVALAFFVERRRAGFVFASLLVVLGIANSHGALLPDLPLSLGRSGDRLERDRGFLLDLEANRKLCAWLEDNHPKLGHPVVTKWPFSQMLTLPELGYVKNPLADVRTPMATPSYAPVKQMSPGESLAGNLVVFSPTLFESTFGPGLAPRPTDQILWIDESSPAPLVVYFRRPTP
jgi:hypothetical protein